MTDEQVTEMAVLACDLYRARAVYRNWRSQFPDDWDCKTHDFAVRPTEAAEFVYTDDKFMDRMAEMFPIVKDWYLKTKAAA
jgi:hypothetical protein